MIRTPELGLPGPAAGASARGFTRFIGVALGGGRGKTTALARLELDLAEERPRVHLAEARLRHGHRGSGQESGEEGGDPLFRDEVLVAYLGRWAGPTTVTAIDAPLTLPPCIRCTLACPGVQACEVPVVEWMRRHAPALSATRRSDPGKPAVTPYTQRAVDVLLTHVGLRQGLSSRESLGQGMGPLAARAAYLRRVLSPQLRLHENLIEVHPPTTTARLFGVAAERKHRHSDSEQAWELRKRMLAALAPTLVFDYVWPEVVVRSPHVFDAVIAGFTAFMWAKGAWQGPMDLLSPPAESSPPLSTPGPLAAALTELGDLWLEDGWIWTPPTRV